MGRKRKNKGTPIDGWVALDKPKGLTSVQAMARVRGSLGAVKAGHAGTLDPMASGCLPIALGKATKKISIVQDGLKEYFFTVKWGTATDSDDAEGEITATSDARPCKDEILKILPKYEGDIVQMPPKFSALKIDGKRAYDLARAGKEVELKPRDVFVKSLALLDCRDGEADFVAVTGKGVYVRSLARDMGDDLKCGGHVSVLRRNSVGKFNADCMISLDKVQEMGQLGRLDEVVLPISFVLDDILV